MKFLKTRIFSVIVFLLDISDVKKNIIVEPSILQSIISTLGIEVFYVKALVRKTVIKGENC